MGRLLDASGPLPLLLVGLAVLVAAAVLFLPWLYRRPQRGLLLLTAVVPFDGLLLLVPHPGFVDGWKEGLVLLTMAMSLLSRREMAPVGRHLPMWVPPVAGLLAVSAASALFVGWTRGSLGLKIGFFYLLIPLILWRHPFSQRDRDRWVSILMVTGVITSLYGLAQQVIGLTRLHAMGYEYDTTIRTAGGFLRAFSSFVQPFPFALFVMFVLLVGGTVAIADPRRPRNALFLLATPILLAAMASSIVRNSFFGLLVGLALLAFRRYRMLALVPVAGLAALLLLPGNVVGTALSSSSLAERGAGWSDIGDVVLTSPWGLGLGTTGSVAEKYALVTGSTAWWYQPDNAYIKALLELGILGIWLLVALMVTACLWSLRVSDVADTEVDSALALGVAAAAAAAAAGSLVATYLEIFPMDILFWLSLGVLTCIPHRGPSGSTRSRSALAAAESRPTSVSSSMA